MKIFVDVKAGSKRPSVIKISELNYVVSVKEPPIEGRANMAVIEALAKYFNVPKNRVTIDSGFTSKRKTIEILS